MATATLTRGIGYLIQGHSFGSNSDSGDYPGDWTWYIGQWSTEYWNEVDYGAGAVAYSVPKIEDGLAARKITIPCSFYNNTGDNLVYAVLSTTKPIDASFRYGPTSGIISDVVTIAGANTTAVTFTLTNGVNISGKTIYMYMYRPNEGFGTEGKWQSVVTKSFENGTITFSAPYKLSINAGAGSSITVKRTASGVGNTGYLSDGATIYYGDKLHITFSAVSNYKLLTRHVNGSSFTSGNTHTVTGNVTVSSTAQPLASDIGATDANIESVSTITIKRYNSSYTNTVTFSFGDITGTIATKTADTSIAWSVPSSFYVQIPNAKTGKCVITCETFSGSASLGKSSCEITVTASQNKCAPIVTGSVTDTNSTTTALTGDSSILIRYKSNAKCEISAAARNGATIKSMTINGSSVAPESPVKTFNAVETTKFVFSVTDSRGYTTTKTITPSIVQYVKLTINPIVARPSPTSGEVSLSFNGKFFNGRVGNYANTLTVRYRYKLSTDSSYSSWITVDASNYTKSTSSYSSVGTILLTDSSGSTTNFDYNKSYYFQVQAYDGANGTALSIATVTAPVGRGTPVFDWGEQDFNINVALKLSEIDILDIIYPVGTVYMHRSSSMPVVVSSVGTWVSIDTSISNVYAWERTA